MVNSAAAYENCIAPYFYFWNMHWLLDLNDPIGLYISIIWQIYRGKHKEMCSLPVYLLEASENHAVQVLCVHFYLRELLYGQHKVFLCTIKQTIQKHFIVVQFRNKQSMDHFLTFLYLRKAKFSLFCWGTNSRLW